jgi:type IV pilus assembly protein PilC
MLSYSYTARNPATGQTIKADLQAESEQAAAALIRKEGLIAVDIHVAGKGGFLGLSGRKKVKIKDKVLFSRQLSTLINAGLPLVQSLRNVAGQTQSKAFRVVINQVINDVEAGASLSVAMSKHPNVFNRVYLSLVQAGETSGTLDKSLERLAIQQEKDEDVIRKVKGAFTYPIIVLIVMMGVVVFMMFTLLPQVQVLYGDTGQSLPTATSFLLAIVNFLKEFWWLALILLGVLIFMLSRWARTGPGVRVIDKLKMRFPLIGPLFMKMYMARFARTGSTLVGSGVPLLQVLEITADAVNNVFIADSIHRAIDKVKGGKSLSESIQGDPNFLELVPNMLHIGEQSGATEQMMSKTADYYEKEVDDQIKSISTIIEPLMMIVMGIIAIGIVGAVLLPVYTLNSGSVV